MTGIRKDAEKTPLSHIIIITLFAVGCIAIPFEYLFRLFISDNLTVTLISGITVRVILSVVAVIFMFKYGYHKILGGFGGALSLIIVLPVLLVAINNAPIVGLVTGNVKLTADTTNIILYVLFCLSVGVYEELVFRGLVLPLSLKITENKKKGAFWAVALSSAVFGLSHIVGIFSGAIGPTFLQVGYSFLIGAMCGISLLYTKNIFVPIILHFVYDVGGLMTAYVAVGNQWDVLTIIITAVLGVIVFIYMLLMALKVDYKTLKPLYYPSDFDENETSESGKIV